MITKIVRTCFFLPTKGMEPNKNHGNASFFKKHTERDIYILLLSLNYTVYCFMCRIFNNILKSIFIAFYQIYLLPY